jgi:hypothetical protein
MSLRERFRLEEKELESLSLRKAFPKKGDDEATSKKEELKCKNEGENELIN